MTLGQRVATALQSLAIVRFGLVVAAQPLVHHAQIFDGAEPLLIDGYEALKANPSVPEVRRHEALERVVELYDAWGKPEQAAEYRALLAEQEAVASD